MALLFHGPYHEKCTSAYVMGLQYEGVTPGRTTLLEAVNVALACIGEQPVNSLEGQQVGEVWMAQQTLLEFHKEGQSRGWSWNMEYEYPFSRDETTKQITIPENVISFSLDPYRWNGRFQLRGLRVYDRVNRSYQIEDGISPLHADVTWLLAWDESPEVFNRWITIRAARVFSDRVLGSDQVFKFTSLDEQQALVELNRVEFDQHQPNSLTGGRGLRPFPTYQAGFGLLDRRLAGGTHLG